MAKFYSLLLFLALITLNLSAQTPSKSNKLSEVVEVQDIEAANVELKEVADGKCALLKIYTTIDRQDLMFKPDMASTIEKIDDSVPGQIWVYLTAGAMQLTVSHREFEETAAFAGLRSGRVYKMEIDFDDFIVIRQQKADGQYLVLHVEPYDAEIVVDGGTPVPASEGYYSSFLSKGEHTIEVKSYLYNSYNETINITTEKIERNVALQPNYGVLSITTNVPSSVAINGMVVGKSPYASQKMAAGEYDLRITAPKYSTIQKKVTVPADGSVLNLDEQLIPLFAEVTLSSPMSDASIYINEEYKGRGSWTGELLPGTYAVKSTCEGHRETIKTIEITDREARVIELDAPMAMYGSINVSSNKPDVDVYIDNKLLGVAPNIFGNILVGEHNVIFKKEGYKEVIMRVNIQEGKIAKVSGIVNEKQEVKQPKKENNYNTNWGSVVAPKETQTKRTKRKSNVESKMLMLVQMGYPISPNYLAEAENPLLSVGFMFGYVKNGGGYFRFSFSGAQYESIGELNTAGGAPSIDAPVYSVETYTAGYVQRVTNDCRLYAGVGYGSLATMYDVGYEEYMTDPSKSYSGVALDFGAMVDWSGFAISIGVSTINFKYVEANLGIGFSL